MYRDIIEQLKRGEDSQKNIYFLSLLYQLTDQYHLEKDLINYALAKYPDWEYGLNRYSWHQLPLFNQMVPRKPIHFPYPGTLPSQEMLENLCFITSGDTQYFPLIVQLIESIRATQFYKDIDVYIIDGGLLDNEKQYLSQYLNVKKIIDVNSIKIVPDSAAYIKMVACRPFLNEIFPGYRYYSYLDADTWIQDERCLHKMLMQCQKQGISVWQCEGHICDGYAWYAPDKILDAEQTESIKNNFLVSANLFCIDVTQYWFTEWQNLTLDAFHKNRIQYGIDEATLTYLVYKYKIKEFLNGNDQHVMWFFIPVIKDGVLYGADTITPVGIMHITGWLAGFLGRKVAHYYLPTQEINGPLSQEEILKHESLSKRVLDDLYNQKIDNIFDMDIFPNQTFASIYYRVFPWENKENLRQIIREEFKI